MLYKYITTIGNWFIPIFLLTVFLHALYKRIPIFDTFVEGATEGFKVILKILPYVVGIYVAIGLFRGSGALNLFVTPLTPLLVLIGIPADVVPLMVIRLLSGPAAMGFTADLITRLGPDSFVGRLASILDSSTDTVIYMLAIYFASANIKNPRYSLAVGLIGALSGYIASIYICNVLY
jgi:spore maturation protein B